MKTDKKGKTLRYHYEAASKQLGRTVKELIPPCEIPAFLIYLWHHFIALDSTRQVGFSTNRITFTEIEAYTRLMREPISASDVRVILKLDELKAEAIKDGG